MIVVNLGSGVVPIGSGARARRKAQRRAVRSFNRWVIEFAQRHDGDGRHVLLSTASLDLDLCDGRFAFELRHKTFEGASRRWCRHYLWVPGLSVAKIQRDGWRLFVDGNSWEWAFSFPSGCWT